MGWASFLAGLAAGIALATLVLTGFGYCEYCGRRIG